MRLFWAIFVFGLLLSCNSDTTTYAVIETDYGNMKIKLYNTTPLHRDNFIKLIKEGYYDGMLFHRVIPNFMIQGGDPISKVAKAGERMGGGGPGYTIPAEIGAPHFKGAIAGARKGDQMNPEKASNGSQFFIVQGAKQTEQDLNNIAFSKGIQYTEEQKKLYRELGGYPSLDNEYTVFGEVLEGLEVVDQISKMTRDMWDRPLEDVRIKTIRLVE